MRRYLAAVRIRQRTDSRTFHGVPSSTPKGYWSADAPPGLVTAVREQLGLRLQSDTAEMEHLVIDSVDRPTPD